MRKVMFCLCLPVLAGVTCGVMASDKGVWLVEKETVDQILIIDGQIEAVNQGTISAQTQGKVARWHVDVNSVVDKGQLLLELDATELQARKDQAEAQLAEARVRLVESQKQFDRIKQLFGKGTVSQAQFDNAEATLQAAVARVGVAVAALAEAGKQLSDTKVVAPYAGIVTARLLETGELATPGKPLISGFSLEEVRVTGLVPQTHAAAIRHYTSVTVALPDGTLVEALRPLLFPFADPQSHQFKIRADLESESGILYPGTWVKLLLKTGEYEAIRLPVAALVSRDELRAVYVVNAQGQMQLRQVRTGNHAGDRIEVLAGLQPGEQVLMDPAAIAAGFANSSMQQGDQ